MTISFSKNGQHLGTAFTLEDEELKDKAVFPHVSTKNVRMSLKFSSPAWSEVEGVEGYLPLQEATEEHKVRATKVSSRTIMVDQDFGGGWSRGRGLALQIGMHQSFRNVSVR